MANVLVDETSLEAIADTIRSKLGVSDTYLPSEMADAIDDIGGGITPTGTKQISITQNGTTTEDVTAYASAQITANVPNSYTQADEGKVVNNGALVSQSSDTVTDNGTYDTTLINSLEVDVASGGGAYETGTYTVATASDNAWRVPTTQKYSHFMIFTSNTFSQNTTATSNPLYIAYADTYGYSAIRSQTNSGFMANGWSVNRLVSEYANNSFVYFYDTYVELRLLGNGAFIKPAVGLNYIWFAW